MYKLATFLNTQEMNINIALVLDILLKFCLYKHWFLEMLQELFINKKVRSVKIVIDE